ncbi:MAG: proton-conducting transporter membrane subunit [Eubacteriales bacterium]|nr:proton-conducting transporter membrane subunit [Eubacteriales bacterium]
MNQSITIILAIFFPVICGAVILLMPKFRERKKLLKASGAVLVLTAVLALCVVTGGDTELTLLYLGENLKLFFRVDALGKMFAVVISIVWLLAGFYSFEYMKHEQEEKRYFGFYLMVYGILLALCFAGNLITFYMFYELMTLSSVPLVLHSRTKEAIMAGLKYLFYSLCGAYLVLLGIYFLSRYTTTLDFLPGGTLDMTLAAGHEELLLTVAFLMILGFGVKAGMFPMHAWLPTAHPVAPAPASAVLSGLIVKAGVLGIIRAVYYIIGADFLKGTWVQTAWLTLTLITVFMGSMLAYREKAMKKRLAYSTVSQASYILFGLALLQPDAMTGSLLHVVFHAFIKSCLFLCAGAIIYKTGKTNVDEMRGIGKEMPVTIWCYTFASMALIGIPPASGFISKWYLATGSLKTGISVFSWLGPVVLLVSALLTAGYLLPVTIHGFLPGADYDYASLKKSEPVKMMVVPLIVLACLAVLLGVFPNPLTSYVSEIIGTLM